MSEHEKAIKCVLELITQAVKERRNAALSTNNIQRIGRLASWQAYKSSARIVAR